MIILICGGRDFPVDKIEAFDKYLDDLATETIDIIVEGGARGVDALAKAWGKSRGVHVATVEALWKTFDKGAGPRRNKAMLLLKPDLVIAFEGGNGTADMVRQANRHGVKVIEVKL